ncbi:MAG: FHA domain-containing protein [Proteobacteria bacterium]|nr:FHA domain-containing protein [Pseudomonadota bacterium]
MNDSKIKVTLTVTEGPDHEKSLQLTKFTNSIGRKNTDFNLQDGRVSTLHTKIEIKDDKVIVIDLNSRNGTLINGTRIEGPTEVQNLDEIEVGFTKIRVTIIENLDFFKNKNVKGMIDEKTTRNADIGGLIKDELERFSKWDLSNPSMDALAKPKESKYPFGFQVKKGPDRGKVFYFDQDRVVVGRGKVEFVLKDPDVSRMHAMIEIKEGSQIMVKDMDSTNGTFVNGKKISSSEIRVGDIVQFGKTVCLFFKNDDTD